MGPSVLFPDLTSPTLASVTTGLEYQNLTTIALEKKHLFPPSAGITNL